MELLITLLKILCALFFKSNRFYCELKSNKNFDFKIWESPGLWCSQKELDQIIQDIQQVAGEKNNKGIPLYGALKGDKTDFENRIITIAYKSGTNSPIGFSAQTFLDIPLNGKVVRVLHLGLVWVIPYYRKKSIPGFLNIFPNILLLIKYGFRPIWISNVSQVPVIVGSVAYFFNNVYPNPLTNSVQSAIHKKLANSIMQHHRIAFGVGEDADYDEEKQIIKNSYTGGSDNLKKTFEECAKFKDERINNACQQNLNYQRGDDYLQLGILTSNNIFKFLNNKSRKINRIFYALFFIIIYFFIFLSPVFRFITKKSNKFNYNGI